MMNEAPPAKRGRPRLYTEPRPRFNLRVRPALYEQIAMSAAANGRSYCEEIEHRLEASFDREALVEALAQRLRTAA